MIKRGYCYRDITIRKCSGVIEEREQQIKKGIKSQKSLSIYKINSKNKQRDYMYSCYVNDYKLIIEFVYELL